MQGDADARLNIRAHTSLELESMELDLAALSALLNAVADTGSLQGGAERTGRSYRGAWGRIKEAETVLGCQLVEKTKGHGSQLTAAGRGLAALVDKIETRVQGLIQRELADLDRELRECLRLREPRLRIACSHDLVMQQCISEGRLPFLDARFMGSPKAVTALREGRAELAGFHVPDGLPMELFVKRSLDGDPPLYLRPLLRREQGLVVARGNPLGIRGIHDLARQSVRFINRQRGSGTRVWFDYLLREHGISPSSIRGYPVEEFTHFAVVAAVAAGAVDVAFALKATAIALGLDFVSLGFETYYLCAPREAFADPRCAELMAHVQDGLLSQPGYARPTTDELVRTVA
ncbi:MAG: helix-turn-helix transcriptional regulator [Rhodocyclaceae bacterium]|nr:helix-turn-helix transcriptional regulator [Rhodocyclaceae bacterium]